MAGRPKIYLTEQERLDSIRITQKRAYAKKHNKTIEQIEQKKISAVQKKESRDKKKMLKQKFNELIKNNDINKLNMLNLILSN